LIFSIAKRSWAFIFSISICSVAESFVGAGCCLAGSFGFVKPAYFIAGSYSLITSFTSSGRF
jgi:hypothetical protein